MVKNPVEQLKFILDSLARRFTYQAVVRPGAGTREERDNPPIVILESESPPILVHPSHLGGALSAGQVFNIGVRLKTKQVRCSPTVANCKILKRFLFFPGSLLRHRRHGDLRGSARRLLVTRTNLFKWTVAVHLLDPRDCRARLHSNVPHTASSTTAKLI